MGENKLTNIFYFIQHCFNKNYDSNILNLLTFMSIFLIKSIVKSSILIIFFIKEILFYLKKFIK